MEEKFLHFLWLNRLLDTSKLHTTKGERIEIVSTGTPNADVGPDFLNAKIRIGGQLWAGNVEMHIKASDWFAHGHERDQAYDSVILHVVYEADMPVYNSKSVPIPTVETARAIPAKILERFRHLQFPKESLACSVFIPEVDNLKRISWLERLYIERMKRKTGEIFRLLQETNNDWEGVLYRMLFRYFGMPHNSGIFFAASGRLPFPVVRKHRHNPDELAALFFGITGLLEGDEPEDEYRYELKRHFDFFRHKYQLNPVSQSLTFGRMRPVNFPTVRLAQLTALYNRHDNLFDLLIKGKDPDEKLKMLQIDVPEYWQTHYVFGKPSRKRRKRTGKNFAEALMLNVILPLQFAFAEYEGKTDKSFVLQAASDLPPENNRIVRLFTKAGLKTENALETQGLLQLHSEYCIKRKCLSCAWGNQFLYHDRHR